MGSAAVPSAGEFVLAAPLAKGGCAHTDPWAAARTIREVVELEFVLGAPSFSFDAGCDESDDEWARLTMASGRSSTARPSTAAAPWGVCRDWMSVQNGTLSASKEDVSTVRLWRHVLRHRRLPKDRSSKKASLGVATVVTRASSSVEATLRPGVMLYHSSPLTRGDRYASSCRAHWSGQLPDSLLPDADLYGGERPSRGGGVSSCTLLWQSDGAASAGARSLESDGWGGSPPPAGRGGVLFVVDAQPLTPRLWEERPSKVVRVLGNDATRQVRAPLPAQAVPAGGAWPIAHFSPHPAAADFNTPAAESWVLLDVRSKESFSRFVAKAQATSAQLFVLDPSLTRYRARLWEEAGLTQAHGPLTTCLSSKSNALLVASLMCSKVIVSGAQSCTALNQDTSDPDCLLLRALTGAGIVCPQS
ncbi:hypothetical protein AB1Y20_017549 [Prymnesium parvum]|uniref:Uncharacterized protein n=1 Tax=Prymnesium parvum TaxID=97485 RepID=A0AB34JPN9_PRYPA